MDSHCPLARIAGRRTNFIVQFTETALINEKTVNETRLQWMRNRFSQNSLFDGFALNVLDSFNGGGSQVGSSSNEQDRLELQNFTSWSTGNHFVKVGARLRHAKIDSISPANFGGTYTFAGGRGPRLDENDQVVLGPNGQPEIIDLSSLERYRRTLAFGRAGLTPAAIRLLGGGATQFSIAGGNPQAEVKQTDVSFYIQDEWKIRPNFTLSPGLRYENQNNVDSNFNFAPRIAFAWSPIFGEESTGKPAAGRSRGSSRAAAAHLLPHLHLLLLLLLLLLRRWSTEDRLQRRIRNLLQPHLGRHHAASNAIQWNQSTKLSRHQPKCSGSVSGRASG